MRWGEENRKKKKKDGEWTLTEIENDRESRLSRKNITSVGNDKKMEHTAAPSAEGPTMSRRPGPCLQAALAYIHHHVAERNQSIPARENRRFSYRLSLFIAVSFSIYLYLSLHCVLSLFLSCSSWLSIVRRTCLTICLSLSPSIHLFLCFSLFFPLCLSHSPSLFSSFICHIAAWRGLAFPLFFVLDASEWLGWAKR